MLRYIMIFGISLSITNCAWEKDKAQQQEDFSPNCSYSLAPTPPLVPSTYPELFDIPHDQPRLLQLMTANDGPCYIKHQGKVRLYKISIPNTVAVAQIGALPTAPQNLQNDWFQQEAGIGRPLLGLTTFNFHAAPDEKLVNATIALRETARMWHMWHEFSHYVIGQKRVDDPHKNISIPDNKVLRKGRDDFNSALQVYWSLPSEDNLNGVMSTFRRAMIDQKNHLEKRYLDEILIEATIIQTVSQSPEAFNFDRIDAGESLATINFFIIQYKNAVQDLEQTMWLPMQQIVRTQEQQKMIFETVTELRDKARALDTMFSEVSVLANRLMRWEGPMRQLPRPSVPPAPKF